MHKFDRDEVVSRLRAVNVPTKKVSAWQKMLREICHRFHCTVQDIYHSAYSLSTHMSKKRLRQRASQAAEALQSHAAKTRLTADQLIPQCVRALIVLMKRDQRPYIIA